MFDIQEISKVEGWLSPKEAKTLYKLAKNNNGHGSIVEIGSWKGKSTICLGRGSEDGNENQIYAIDPHSAPAKKLKDYLKEDETSTFHDFERNIENANLESLVTPIVDFSFNALDKVSDPIDLIFIDGSHEYEDVLKDFQLYYPSVREGGIIAFHDTTGGGPFKVVVKELYQSGKFKNVKFIDSITYGTKVKSNTLTQRLRNRMELLLFRSFISLRQKRLPGLVKSLGKTLYKRIK